MGLSVTLFHWLVLYPSVNILRSRVPPRCPASDQKCLMLRACHLSRGRRMKKWIIARLGKKRLRNPEIMFYIRGSRSVLDHAKTYGWNWKARHSWKPHLIKRDGGPPVFPRSTPFNFTTAYRIILTSRCLSLVTVRARHQANVSR